MVTSRSIQSILALLSRSSIALSLIVGAGLCAAIALISSEADYAYSNTVPSVAALGKAATDVGALTGQLGSHVLADTPEKTKVIDDKLAIDLTMIDRELADYKSLVSDAKEQELYDTTLHDWKAVLATLPALRKESLAVHTVVATDLFNKSFEPATEKVRHDLAGMVEYNQGLASAAQAETSRYSTLAIVGGVVGSAILVACSLAVGVVSKRRVVRPLSDLLGSVNAVSNGRLDTIVSGTGLSDEIGDLAKAFDGSRVASLERVREQQAQTEVVEALTEGLEKLAAGNLTIRIDGAFDSKYETLRHSFNQAVSGLGESLALVASAASQVDQGAGEIFSAAHDLATRNESQAASLEETNAAMQTVARSVDLSASDAKDMQQSIAVVVQSARDGEAVVGQAMAAMGEIEESSQKITQIVNMIDGIAFQTNLLALNAGVEAARAGESGKGFAVVANEVRALAQRSADAAREISALIARSTEQVDNGVKLVLQSGDRLHEISDALGKSIGIVSKIADASATQATSVKEVSTAVSEMDRMTQQNAAMAEESNAAAGSLSSSARELAALVGRFELPQTAGSGFTTLLRKAA